MSMVVFQVVRAFDKTMPPSVIRQRTGSGRPFLLGADSGAGGLHIRGRGEKEIGRVAYV